MSQVGRRILPIVVVLAMVLTGLAPPMRAQEANGAATAFSFQDLNFNELITSTVYLEACDSLRPATGTVNLATFKRASGACWSGSGTVIAPDGLVLTNSHVALDRAQAEPVWVLVNRTVDARSLPQPAFFAQAVLYSPAWGGATFGATLLDLAVLTPTLTLDGAPIQAGEVTMRPLPMAATEGTISIGDDLRNIGYPGIGGAQITVTEGTVSGFEPDGNVQQLGNAGWIKTDATLGGGISGGTTIDQNGFQIGVPTELGETETRAVCRNESGQTVDCNIGQINHVRPVPEGFNLLQDIGLGDGLPDAAAGPDPPQSNGSPQTTAWPAPGSSCWSPACSWPTT
jgi:S1-C subfamily serine protease